MSKVVNDYAVQKPMKADVGYHHPDDCCGTCSFAYRSSYMDCQCSKLFVEDNTIDLGAICNLYQRG